ncbi:LCP family protein [Paradesulfitobacterium ferrireducens]|uniref:LCP family protein n=1 Tax=Paradesulfitobacterium ferrireducens TaxID=2816476 RepID=UPI001A8D0569|nr:LCP family protein [Paradesulfitobacterium ferrireducens]
MSISKSLRKSYSGRVLASIGLILILILIGTGALAYAELSKIKVTQISRTDEALGIKPQPPAEGGNPDNSSTNGFPAPEPVASSEIRNIALFGVDTGRLANDVPHSDTIMILTVDQKHNKIKLSSIMRDSYIEIEGRGKTKITEAYTYGGPQLALKTLNQNFDLNIRDFITVDFVGLSRIIDAVGGVELEVKTAEIPEINKYLNEVAQMRKERAVFLKKAGVQKLNGMQAVTYARIRNVGNGDFTRVDRQNKVLNALAKRVKELGPAKYPALLDQCLPYVETSMSPLELTRLSKDMISAGLDTPEWQRFPLDGQSKGEMIKGIWYLTFDLDAAKEQMRRFMYEDLIPVSK